MADTPLDTLDCWRAQQTNERTEGERMPRLTVRLPRDLYARLEAFAAQYRSHRGAPPLAGCVREMVTFCLDHPDLFRPPIHAQEPAEEAASIAWQAETITAPAPQGSRPHYRRPENAPDFDATRYFVGVLCLAGHRYQGQEGSLRYLRGPQNCVTCRRERNQRYNARRRERQAWQQTMPQRR